MSGGFKVERANQDCWRIIVADKIVGFAIRMSNGGWCLFDQDDRIISYVHYDKPKLAGEAMIKRLRGE